MFVLAKREMDAINKSEKEAIHSGHFMVSHFEAEEQDDEYEVAVPIPEEDEVKDPLIRETSDIPVERINKVFKLAHQLSIDTSLAKLFQCMSIAYRQKLTSPKWNRFRGIRLRWKDKIRLNNVIWRCWHMQFIKKHNTLVCQFASPLDVDTHNKPEAIVLEGKYWKRKLAAVTAEYKKWRMFYRAQISGQSLKDNLETLSELDALTWHSQSSDSMNMMVDEDYMSLMSDTLFSTITNQPFVFPDSREIARAGIADFIQPSLGPLQPNLDDYMDTFEPLQEFISCKLPTVPEENGSDINCKQENQQIVNWCYSDLDLLEGNSNINSLTSSEIIDQYQPMEAVSLEKQQDLASYDNDMVLQAPSMVQFVPQTPSPTTPPPPLPPPPPPATYQPPNSSYQMPAISKGNKKKLSPSRSMKQTHIEQQQQFSSYRKSVEQGFSSNYALQNSVVAADSVKIQTILPQQETVSYNVLPHQPQQQQQQSFQAFKFTTPLNVPNIKFSSQTAHSYKASSGSQSNPALNEIANQRVSKIDSCIRSTHTKSSRQRSVSHTRESPKRPPLLSAVSDPALVTPSTSVLLTQLLTSNSPSNVLLHQNASISSTSASQEQQTIASRMKDDSTPSKISSITHTSPVPCALIINTGPFATPTTGTDPLFIGQMNTSNSNSPVHSHSSPTSPQADSPPRDSFGRDQRRAGHIHAEQKRRYNIKNGFDMIHSLIPQLNQNPNTKLSKAAMLQKGAEYIRQLQQERSQLKDEMDNLRQQIETLNTAISNCQSMLPATGAPVSRKRSSKMQEMFDEYVRKRTMEDWKFWIFSLLFKPLLVSFNNFVSTSSMDDLYRSTMLWIEQHCTLVDLRPIVLNSLRYLCTKTDILSDPEMLPEQARQIVMSPNSNNSQN
ncbi:carbohydrate-responsive element-binding protein [Agrilus planipennis]|uniref:Carbohydrate-responsive element-binding protein n=1 Tax=Agrilus planipennis TaxID=224129 RepID=A0A1W4WSP2_AGRPL|nr:carbohydrate-responsive element-binding protein [Agrilus planipennis]